MHLRTNDPADGSRGRHTSATRQNPILAIAAGLATGAATAAMVAAVAVTPAMAAPATEILTWGDNEQLQLGDATRTGSSIPVNVRLPAGESITGVSAGCQHSLAVTSSGIALAWGSSLSGQLGDGTTTSRDRATQVNIPTGFGDAASGAVVNAVAAGCSHSLALTATGEVLAWGSNEYGQLGDGSKTDQSSPVPVRLSGVIDPTSDPVVAVAAGESHSLAVTLNGEVLAWGRNDAGQLGNGSKNDSDVPVPVHLPSGTWVTAVAGGDGHSLAVTRDGRVLAWGFGFFGQLGNDSYDDSDVPVWTSLPDVTVTDVAAGSLFSLAATADRRVLTWGFNQGGLGYEDSGNVRVKIPQWVSLPDGAAVTQVAAGSQFGLATTIDGRALGWGLNSSGQLGNNSTDSSSVPVWASLPDGTTLAAVDGGNLHTVALPANPEPTTTHLTAAPTRAPAGTPVTLTAIIRCPAVPTGTVTFADSTTARSTMELADGMATYTVDDLAAGTYTFTARYSGDSDCAGSTSDPVTVTMTSGAS